MRQQFPYDGVSFGEPMRVGFESFAEKKRPYGYGPDELRCPLALAAECKCGGHCPCHKKERGDARR